VALDRAADGVDPRRPEETGERRMLDDPGSEAAPGEVDHPVRADDPGEADDDHLPELEDALVGEDAGCEERHVLRKGKADAACDEQDEEAAERQVPGQNALIATAPGRGKAGRSDRRRSGT
jgi:hypothetical protein